jgi:hypothetical protein
MRAELDGGRRQCLQILDGLSHTERRPQQPLAEVARDAAMLSICFALRCIKPSVVPRRKPTSRRMTRLHQRWISSSLPNVRWIAENAPAANRPVERSSNARRQGLGWTASLGRARHDRLPVACSVSTCLCHARLKTLLVRASARHLIDRQHRRARTSRASAGDNTQNRLERRGPAAPAWGPERHLNLVASVLLVACNYASAHAIAPHPHLVLDINA